jgi:hypothetical protein
MNPIMHSRPSGLALCVGRKKMTQIEKLSASEIIPLLRQAYNSSNIPLFSDLLEKLNIMNHKNG